MSCSSGAEPLQLTWSNNTLTPDGKSVTSGVVVSVGTPPQQLALTPVFTYNNTFINNIATCGSNSNDTCISYIGGGFSSSQSSTFELATSGSWNGSVEDGPDLLLNTNSIYFNDEMTIGSLKIPAVPLLEQATGSLAYGGLGVGKDAPFIQELVASGSIPSSSFSLYTGLYSSSKAGSLILGGYANRFYQGQLYEHNDTSSCTICMNVTGLVYKSGATSIDLFANRTERYFEAVMEPYLPTIGLPTDVAYAFGNATGGVDTESDSGLWWFDKGMEPNASLVVTLQSGFVTTIPHEALFAPPAYTNGQLASSGANASRTYSLVQPWSVLGQTSSSANASTNAGWFGVPFAAFVYVIRDYERHLVQFAEANQAAVVEGNATAICSINSKERSSGHASHVGAIVGGVIGGVVGLALIAFAVWFWRRRSKRSKATSSPEEPTSKPELPNSAARAPLHEAPLTTDKGELPADKTTQVEELAADKDTQVGELAADKNTQVEELASDSSTQVEEMPSNEKVHRAELPA